MDLRTRLRNWHGRNSARYRDAIASHSEIQGKTKMLADLERKLDDAMKKIAELERKVDDASRPVYDMEFLLNVGPEHVLQLFPAIKRSKAQNRQDLFALAALGLKRNGFFVDFGATDGVDLSNSYMLEQDYGWTGILAEPARCWHEAIAKNRKSPVETKCVWSKTGATVTFNETDVAELSTISAYSELDGHVAGRKDGKTYEVETISLNDLLEKYHAPEVIDFLSIDTEGSEYDILSNLDFGKYQFRVISCEHNYTPMRDKIFDLLSSHGYQRKFEIFSRWDDWYVKA